MTHFFTHFELQIIATMGAVALVVSVVGTAGHLGTRYAGPRTKRVLLEQVRRLRAKRGSR